MRLIIIGNLEGQIGAATELAHKRGVNVRHFTDIAPALTSIRDGKGADLIMIDVACDVEKLISSLNLEHISIPVVGCGINNNAEDAVKAIKAGAKEYVPFPPEEELMAALFEAISYESNDVLYHSKEMQELMQVVGQVATSDASVLVTGESGTGKEVISRYIHQHSNRADQPFISLNCAAIPDNLLESELFGHEKGAFTGAVARRIGKFEEANHGTILLDEISEMDIRLQAKLLRAIQERVIERVGGSKQIPLDIRILATSNRDLSQAVQEGTFREDLYFRLNVINVQIPSLRERKDDIIYYAEHFLKKYSQMNDVPFKPLSEKAKQVMLSYDWPGNVRELENTMHRATLLTSGTEVTEQSIMLTNTSGSSNTSSSEEGVGDLVGRTVESVEKDLILNTLDHCLGNRTHAANILGISIRTLRNKLKVYEDAT